VSRGTGSAPTRCSKAARFWLRVFPVIRSVTVEGSSVSRIHSVPGIGWIVVATHPTCRSSGASSIDRKSLGLVSSLLRSWERVGRRRPRMLVARYPSIVAGAFMYASRSISGIVACDVARWRGASGVGSATFATRGQRPYTVSVTPRRDDRERGDESIVYRNYGSPMFSSWKRSKSHPRDDDVLLSPRGFRQSARPASDERQAVIGRVFFAAETEDHTTGVDVAEVEAWEERNAAQAATSLRGCRGRLRVCVHSESALVLNRAT